MLKKYAKIEWTLEVKREFKYIKGAITTTPVLVNLNYQVPFKIYSFSSEHSCARVLMQKKDGEDERLICFMSFPLKNFELNYPNLDK